MSYKIYKYLHCGILIASTILKSRNASSFIMSNFADSKRNSGFFKLLFQNRNTDKIKSTLYLHNKNISSTPYLDVIFGTGRSNNNLWKAKYGKPKKNRLSTYFLFQLSAIESSMRQFSQRSFSVINGTMAGDIGFDPIGKIDRISFLCVL